MQAESFAASFRNIGLTAPQPRGPRSLGDVLPVQYDLGTQTGSSAAMAVQSTRALAGTIDVRKQIRVGKAAAAPIDMKVGSGANLYVNVAQLSSMLKTQGKVLEAPSGSDPDGFVSLDSLRNSGFKVRYDAAGDAIVIDGDG
ncbi:hypothetical protein [Allopontixanthobacter sp.]|uniref:hypothetical protein n=1 Tax=Allopontixanthobacter sp. TaxID=2906452 RepID=UPI002ABC31CF|nr:hypothetical protein [Allopontixanthobacter sp.]MDZ4307006.1 hypothetical protein [Allopontixanthobacter sp.]